MFKYLEPIKTLGVDDKTTSQLITCAYDYYQTKKINKNIASQKEYAKLLSCIVRFFGCVNVSRQADEELFQNYLKSEGLKGKPESIKLLNDYIKQIREIQNTRVFFSAPNVDNVLSPIPNKANNKGRSIRKLVNFDYKIDVAISSNYSNKLLAPQIYFIFTLDDGEVIKAKVDLRMFNEFRKDLAVNIKKILVNESIPYLFK